MVWVRVRDTWHLRYCESFMLWVDPKGSRWAFVGCMACMRFSKMYLWFIIQSVICQLMFTNNWIVQSLAFDWRKICSKTISAAAGTCLPSAVACIHQLSLFWCCTQGWQDKKLPRNQQTPSYKQLWQKLVKVAQTTAKIWKGTVGVTQTLRTSSFANLTGVIHPCSPSTTNTQPWAEIFKVPNQYGPLLHYGHSLDTVHAYAQYICWGTPCKV